MVMIEDIERIGQATYLTLSTDKKAANITVHDDGRLNVTCVNASHRVWRGAGRSFATVDDALSGYKSGDIKSLIRSAVDLVSEPV